MTYGKSLGQSGFLQCSLTASTASRGQDNWAGGGEETKQDSNQLLVGINQYFSITEKSTKALTRAGEQIAHVLNY